MPSGVSHGSALPLLLAGATFSSAISAKFGMRLMLLASFVMPGLVPDIHALLCVRKKDVDGRDICAKTRFAQMSGHDASMISCPQYHNSGNLSHGPGAGG